MKLMKFKPVLLLANAVLIAILAFTVLGPAVALAQVNTAPVANSQGVATAEDTPLVITLSGTDVETTDLTFSIVTEPAHGARSAIIDNPGVGGTPNTDTASVTYTPAANYNGSDSFTYKVNDGTADSAQGTVSITINAVNDVPTAENKSVSTNEDTALVITLSGTDVETIDLTFSIVTPPTHGTLGGITNQPGTGAHLKPILQASPTLRLPTTAVPTHSLIKSTTARGIAVTPRSASPSTMFLLLITKL